MANEFDILGTSENEENFDEKDKYLVFVIDDELYGVNINYVIEIVGIGSITPVPDYPDFAPGVMQLRGEVIPIIDPRIIFNKPKQEFGERICAIIIEYNDGKYAYVVDKVSEITDFGDNDITDPPKIYDDYIHRFIIGVSKVNDKIVMVLNPRKMFNSSELKK
ncbi:MAG: purine-binding chemotaxis protein CheW [Oscillospiraceae bacterium]|nr:purine-binding chemotaxis protein CheW [Oscillospiraceae bacterium]